MLIIKTITFPVNELNLEYNYKFTSVLDLTSVLYKSIVVVDYDIIYNTLFNYTPFVHIIATLLPFLLCTGICVALVLNYSYNPRVID